MAIGGTGFLSDVVTKIRKRIVDPTSAARYSDDEILEMVRTGLSEALSDINRTASNKIRTTVDITVVVDQQYYALPPTIMQFLRLSKINTTTGTAEWEMVPNHPLNPNGPGFIIHGPVLQLLPIWKQAETLRIDYVPNGEATLFECTTAVDGFTSTTVTAPTTLLAGSRDTRANAYLGYVLRVLTSTDANAAVVQERIITAYNNITRVFTFQPALSPVPVAGSTVTFEVLPQHWYRLEELIVWSVMHEQACIAKDGDAVEAAQKRRDMLLRSVVLDATQLEARRGKRFERTVPARHRQRFGLRP